MAMSDQENDMSVDQAHAVLREHYGEEVRPVHEVCQAITTWLRAIHTEHLHDSDDHILKGIAQSVEPVSEQIALIAANKSNLLYRLIYLRQPLRTKKCPKHQGHWSGYGWNNECECMVGADITGWLPS